MGKLDGKKIAFLATDGVEQVELIEPRKAVEAEGAEVELVSLKKGEFQGFDHLDKGQTFTADKAAKDADPDDYDGGELEIEGSFGTLSYKLSAGHMVLYPSTSLHRVTAVTRGERVSCFFWLQSLVADHAARELLYDLDQSVQALTAERGKADREVLRLTVVYHNLVRRWAEA